MGKNKTEYVSVKYEGTKIFSLETYEQDKTLVKMGWGKDDPHYIVFVGRITNDGDSLYRVDWYKRYSTEEEAKRAYWKQVAKVQKEEQ